MLLYPICLQNKALQTPSPSQQIVMRTSNEMFYSHQSVNPHQFDNRENYISIFMNKK